MTNPAPSIQTLVSGLSWFDLEFLGRPHAIATVVAADRGSVAVIDPGPTTCLPALEGGLARLGLGLGDVTHILLTHIHLDHAGATGTILRRNPDIAVLVHERGAPHVADPGKLVQSAARLYGDAMDRLWGEVAPVPFERIEVLHGGERVAAGGRTFEVAYTPGHASHHISFLDVDSRVAFVGDTGGVRAEDGVVLPPTTPPDIDVEAWRASAAAVEAWDPAALFRTHFGPSTRVRGELAEMLERLEGMAAMVRALLEEPGTDEERAARFTERLRHLLRRDMSDAQVDLYAVASPFPLLWLGLARYWRRRA